MTDDLYQGDTLALANYAERAYLEYAVSVVKGRALPDVSDGQKPVQRRILYAMHELGLSATNKPRKSAAVVGDVLGKFHPHGDAPVYEALVRMAQDFSLRYPLIDGQGNFGSRDGDGAAAMRYTEARLTPIAQLLLSELSLSTVDFQANYDGSNTEPVLLPARVPMLLLNGASGIAVGMATEIPAHNIKEVIAATIALLKRPELTTQALLQLCPGPDFATGAQIISSASVIQEVYETGRGSLRVRARYRIEDRARGQWQLVFDELPPHVSAQKVLEEIEDITNPKIKTGKKSLLPEQVQSKQELLALLEKVRDESGKDAAVRLVFEPRSKNIDPDEFVTTLLSRTSLESNVSVNLVTIGLDGRPAQKNLQQILSEWLSFRRDAVTRRSQHQLAQVQARIHLLQGRQIVYLQVERVIAVIRAADEPRTDLMQQFALSETQAEDILEMRLRQLARLEGFKIERELTEQTQRAAELETLLAQPELLRKLMIKELEHDSKQFADPRRTLIAEADRAQAVKREVRTPLTLIVSQMGWLRARQGHQLAHDTQFKSGDALYASFEVHSTDVLLAFGSDGRVYTIALSALNTGRGDGVPIVSLIDLAPASRLLHFYAGTASDTLLLAASNGYGFTATVGDISSRLRAGKQFINLEPQDELLVPLVVQPDVWAQTVLACLSASGQLLLFLATEIKSLAGGGKGLMLQKIVQHDRLVGIVVVPPTGVVLHGLDKNATAQTVNLLTDELKPFFEKRGHKGWSLLKHASATKAKLLKKISGNFYALAAPQKAD